VDQQHFEDRVVVVAGAGNRFGRTHALAFAAAGAAVVVNDLGRGRDGSGGSAEPAQQVVDKIIAAGGRAVANTDDVSTWDGAKVLVDQAVGTFGGVDLLVKNPGMLRDRILTSMSEAGWDAVIAVHLEGTFCPTRHAADDWRQRTKSGLANVARVINTISPSSLFGSWAYGPEVHSDERWTTPRLDAVMPDLLAKSAPNAEMTGQRPLR